MLKASFQEMWNYHAISLVYKLGRSILPIIDNRGLTMLSKVRFEAYPLVIWSLIVILASASAAMEYVVMSTVMIWSFPLVLGICFLWPKRWQIIRWKYRNWVMIPMVFAIGISVVCTSWPFKISFNIAKPTLETIAARVENGEYQKMPVQIGLLRIKSVMNYQGTPCLSVGDDPDNFVGFARSKYKVINRWTSRKIDDDWQFVSED